MGIFHFDDFKGFGSQEDGSEDKDYSSYYNLKKPKHWKRWLAIAIILVVLIATFGGAYAFYMEFWQVEEIGQQFTSVFWTNLIAKSATVAAGFLVIFGVTLLNLLLAKKFVIDKYIKINFLKKKWPYVLACLILALLMSNVLKNDLYIKLLQAMNGTSFQVADPLFSQDVGYYVFLRPFLMTVTTGLKGILLFQIIAVAVIYLILFFTNGYKNLKQMFQGERKAIVHIVINILCYFLLMVLTYKFVREDILYASFGKEGGIFGAGYVDATIWLNYYKIIPFVLLAVIVVTLIFLYKNKMLPTILSIAVIPVAFLVTAGAAGIVQSLMVSPNERNMERPFIENNMQATTNAYNLNNVSETEYVVNNELDAKAIEENRNVIDNIRITDFGATLTAYNQLQYLRRYYTFNDTDIVPYEIDGKTYALSIAAREMNKDNIEQSAQSYANKMFRYTHGYGAVVSPINQVTAEGQPMFYVKDIPPKSTNGMPEITQPRIYYGELTNDYVIVNPNKKELDYSEGVSDIENSYDGQGGIQLNFMKRLLFSIYQGDYKMFVSGNIDNDSKILLNRNIMKRIDRIAPFFLYDSDPYLVIDDEGGLKWVVDGYTSTDKYPYSQPHGNLNYIRNSVKVIVDAYDGTVDFYITDESDPIVQTYAKIYPDLFTEGPIPEKIASHITMPQFMFKTQAEMYQRYHVANAEKFYDKDDVWRVATEKYVNNEVAVEPYFNVITPVGAEKEELMLTMPFVLGDKYNMVGLLMARTTPGHYGELSLYRFPKSTTVYGPMQIENKIDNDPDISREMTLWGQGGSTVIRGNLLVIPFQQSLLYVEPIYITSQNNASLPELKRIVVGYKDAIAMETSLDKALEKVFAETGADIKVGKSDQPGESGEQQTPLAGATSGLAENIQKTLDAYQQFKNASGNNDWEAMGKALSELDSYMKQLEESKKEQQ